MKPRMQAVLLLTVTSLLLAMTAGCSSEAPAASAAQAQPAAAQPAPAAATPIASAPASPMAADVSDSEPAQPMEAGVSHSDGKLHLTVITPTGDRRTSTLMLEKIVPDTVLVGMKYQYEIQVTNLTRGPLNSVTVTDTVGTGLKVSGSSPQAVANGETLTWKLDELTAGQTKKIVVEAVASEPGRPTQCATAAYANSAKGCLALNIVQPKLQLAMTAADNVLRCQTLPVKLVVTNAGTGEARNVKVTQDLPEGLRMGDGSAKATMDAGNLSAGQSKEFNLVLHATRTGRFTNQASATGDNGLSANASAVSSVTEPKLQVAATAPKMRYTGRPISYDISVANSGDAAAGDTVVTATLSNGMRFVSADNGGKYSGGQVTWSLGDLAAGASKKLGLVATSEAMGDVTTSVSAKAVCGQGTAVATTNVQGIPAVLLECVDLSDPIEVGGEEVYEVTVTNQGSANDTNIVIKCTLPAEQSLVSAKGPTNAQSAGQDVTFAALPKLAPKDKAVYRITVKGNKAGDVRFKVTLTSDNTSSPVEETESTHIYE
ncbi:MAG: Large cysteine-rich periplasmic protein OmcB [Phycisphaerae bacterium]|nr:Large cysteine-rich periplasmic protein OmcB [Phycisphaerae bacterium]